MLESYAGGVNTFIQTASELPIEYRIIGSGPEPWEPWHSMAVFKVRHILMGSFERKLWNARMVRRLGYRKAQEAIPESRPGELLIVPPGAEYSGPTDKSLPDFLEGAGLAGASCTRRGWKQQLGRAREPDDQRRTSPRRGPASGLEAPSVYYQNHIACDEFDVVGLSFPGVPGFPHLGTTLTSPGV